MKEEGREALKIGHCCDLAAKMDLPPQCVAVLEVQRSYMNLFQYI